MHETVLYFLHMRTVIYFKDSNGYHDRQKLVGAAAFAKRNDWNLQTAEPSIPEAEARRLLQLWAPDGVIINDTAGLNRRAVTACRGLPMVLFSPFQPDRQSRAANLRADSHCVAEAAARELMTLRSASYAFVSHPDANALWNVIRRTSFRDALMRQGFEPHEFTLAAKSPVKGVSRLAGWLKGLSLPCSIFAANDATAARVLEACRLARLSVPDDIAVIGVDNDSEFCESTRPTLSSIGFDFIAAGRLAAETLDDLMRHPRKRLTLVHYPPSGIIRRESTRRLARSSPAIRAALELIRRRACDGLGAREVLDAIPGSRRMAELRFRKLTGRSVLEEIREVRLSTAKQLLANPGLSIDSVARQTGYATPAAFTTFFKSMTGRTPSLWRVPTG